MKKSTILKGKSKEFDMKDLGEIKIFFGMIIDKDKSIGILNLSHFKYIAKVLGRFNMM